MLNYTLSLIRHGLTEGNLKGRYTGLTDLPLADEGYAAIAGYKDFYPDVQKVYSSPLKRCTETAEIIYPNRMIMKIDGLRELDFGEFEGKTADELENRADYTEWLRGGYDARPPGGESHGEFTLRCINALGEIFADMMNAKITRGAVITHGGVITTLLSGFGLPKGRPADYMIKQGEGFAIELSTFLWSKGPAFEIIGKLFYNRLN